MKPHKHADCIKAWADGAEIEAFNPEYQQWIETANPGWFPDVNYRVKKFVKQDDVKQKFGFTYDTRSKQVKHFFIPQIEVTFDGNTGDVKHIEVLK